MSRVMRITRHLSSGMRITRAPCQRYVLISQEKKKEKKKWL